MKTGETAALSVWRAGLRIAPLAAQRVFAYTRALVSFGGISRLLRVWTVGILIVAAAAVPSLAQTGGVSLPPARTDQIARVSVDLSAGAFDRVLPFDVPFFIAGKAPDGVRGLDVQYASLPPSGDTSALSWLPAEPLRWRPEEPAAGDETFVVLVRTPLNARGRYLFRFSFLSDRRVYDPVTVEGRTSTKGYVSADVGVLYAGDIGIGALYVGSNIYFRPVNKEAPLSDAGSIGRRLSLTVGITLSGVGDEDNRPRSDLFWNQSLVLGGGYRITSAIRGGGGALLFLESDPNPLIDKKSIAASWYVSFSFDVDVAKMFR